MIFQLELCPIEINLSNVQVFEGEKYTTKKQIALTCIFLLIVAHMFRRWKHMQKSLVWKGFLSESMRGEDYINLSFFRKFVFWFDYPFSYVRFLQVVVWDRIDRLFFRDFRTRPTKTRTKIVEVS
jgi:hypothetical protein